MPIVFRRIFDLCTNVENAYMNQGEAHGSASAPAAQGAGDVDASAARPPAAAVNAAGAAGEDEAVEEAAITCKYYAPLLLIM